MNGIIIEDKVYEIAEWGKRECNDCSLHRKCQERPIDAKSFMEDYFKIDLTI